MALGGQAKILTKTEQKDVLAYIETTMQPVRNKVIFLLSVRAGFRAKEIASISWEMLTDASNAIAECASLQDVATKGKSGGVVWLNDELRQALRELQLQSPNRRGNDRVIQSQRGTDVTPQVIVNLFWGWYRRLRLDGCSSHSGRRTFITNAARKISTVGGSLKDVQMLARHSSLAMTQKYIEADSEAQKKIVQII